MTTYQVSLEHMSVVEGEMQAITAALGRTLSELDDGVKAKLAHWLNSDSVASRAYLERQNKWDAEHQSMQDKLVTAQQAIGSIGEYYRSGEKYGVGLWEG